MRRLSHHFRAHLIGGLFLVIPGVITYVVLGFLWNNVQDLVRPAVQRLPGPIPTGALNVLAVLVLILFLYLVGIVGRTLVGARLLRLWERLMELIPLVRPVYRVARDTTRLLQGGASFHTSRVVLLHYPRPGVLSLGLVTGIYSNSGGEELLTVYIPTAITPTAGFLVFVKKEEVIETTLTFEDAMKIAISAGLLTEEVFRARQLPQG